MTKYNSLDDALALIGLITTAPDDITDEQVLEFIEADSEHKLESLVLTLAGIAAGLALSISDEKGEDDGEALRRLGAARSDVEE